MNKKKDINSKEPCDNSKQNSKQLISNAPKSLESYDDLVELLSNSITQCSENYNIGVIGSFGTGKSSFLKRFKEKDKEHKIVSVSLANFQNQNKPLNNPESNNSETEKEDEKYLESIIIQQILYSVRRWRLPGSRIKRIGFRIRSMLLIAFFILATLALILYETLQIDQQFIWAKYMLLYSSFSLFALSFIFLLLCFPLTSIVASFHGVQVKSEPNINSTLFDEYLDELIYFFYKTKTDIVIFEDIDRCSTDDIFSKLRTLNFTLNNSPYFKNQKIRFIYAVKEDLFISSETRSKFFDVLISLPPLLSKSNSYEHLSSILDECGLFKFDKRFIRVVSSFIDSYRQINNIVNDFMVFSIHQFKNKQLESSVAKRLFTILTFKSLYPYDYLLFVNGSGYLWHLVTKGKKDYALKPEYNTKYVNPSNNEVYKKIEDFYSALSEYIDRSSISLVSLFVPSSYKSHEEKIFYDSIQDFSDYYIPNHVYEHASDIISNEDAKEHITSSLFLNISILRELLKLPSKSNLAESFFESFNLATEQQGEFIKFIISCLNDDPNLCFSFFRRISAYYPNLVHLLKEAGIFDNATYSKRFFGECINDKTSLVSQNKKGELIEVINNSAFADELICNLNSECADYVLSLQITVPILNLDSFYNGNSDYKNNFVKISQSGKFKRDYDNYCAFVKSIAYSQNINSDIPMVAQLLSIKDDGNVKSIKTSFIELLNNSSKEERNVNDAQFGLCSNELLIKILNTITNQNILNFIIDNCPIINILDISSLPAPILKQLAMKNKLKAPISVWDSLCVDLDVENKFIDLIYTDFSKFLDKEDSKSDSYIQLVSKIVNDDRCDYSLAGKIFELTCITKSIPVNKLTNKNSLKCAISYRYCAFAAEDIGMLDEDLLTLYLNSYNSEIMHLDDASIKLESHKLKILLKESSIENKCLVLNKYVKSIEKENAEAIKGVVDTLSDPFDSLSQAFIELYLCSNYTFGDNTTSILLKHYQDISNFDNLVEKIAEKNIKFSCSSLMVDNDFKSFIKQKSSGKYYVRTFVNKYFIFVHK